jgi:tRNA(Ile)-lysidine synthase
MPAAPTDALGEGLLALIAGLPQARRCWVAYSGGLDSAVLLAVLARLRPRLRMELRAVYIDHGLHSASADWASHCARHCDGLGVSCDLRRVRVEPAAGKGREAAARVARYAALAELVGPGDLVLTAHHRDDQAETLLLALLRGSGVQGLAAMPRVAPLGAGLLVRPLLDWSRAELHGFAQALSLDWVEDPSNLDLSLDRNFLRVRVLPLLAERWPAAGRTLARSADHCAEAAELVGRYARDALAGVRGTRPGALSVAGLLALDPALCRGVLRQWFGDCGVPAPDTRHLGRIRAEVLIARPDASPLVAWGGCEVRRHRDDLFALAPSPARTGDAALPWTSPILDLPTGLGRLRLRDGTGCTLAPAALGSGPLAVRFAVSGLVCRPAGRLHHRHLKHLFQEGDVPAWVRGHIPLVFAEGCLVAIGGAWICDGPHRASWEGVQIEWSGHPWEGLGIVPGP